MAHFAELDNNDVVQRVIVVADKNTSDSNGNEVESIGVAFCKSLYGENSNWVKCSRSGSIRNFMPGPGFVYNRKLDVFCNPQPFPSWTLNGLRWEAPHPAPELTEEQERLGYCYVWVEERYEEDNSLGWQLFTPQVIQIAEQPADLSVNVSAGSSVEISATVSISEGMFGASLITIVDTIDGVDYWNIPNVPEYNASSLLDENNLTATFTTPVLTAEDNGREFKIKFKPVESGVEVETESVVITIV